MATTICMIYIIVPGHNKCNVVIHLLHLFSPQTADVLLVVASLPPLFFGGREATTENTSPVRRLKAKLPLIT